MSRDMPQAKPSAGHRLAARRLMREARSATLATRLEDGAPYASLVTIATDHDGAPILLLSGLADHTRNLDADGRCSLLVEAASHLPNPQTGPRATLVGRAERMAPGDEADRLRHRFLARHPGAAFYAGFGDFAFWRVTVERVHWVGGFARAVWLDDGVLLPADRAAAFAAAEPSVIAHMNQDHADAVEAYATGLLGQAAGPWRLRTVDADGLDLGCATDPCDTDQTEVDPSGADAVVARLCFEPPLESPEALRSRLVELAAKARA